MTLAAHATEPSAATALAASIPTTAISATPQPIPNPLHPTASSPAQPSYLTPTGSLQLVDQAVPDVVQCLHVQRAAKDGKLHRLRGRHWVPSATTAAIAPSADLSLTTAAIAIATTAIESANPSHTAHTANNAAIATPAQPSLAARSIAATALPFSTAATPPPPSPAASFRAATVRASTHGRCLAPSEAAPRVVRLPERLASTVRAFVPSPRRGRDAASGWAAAVQVLHARWRRLHGE